MSEYTPNLNMELVGDTKEDGQKTAKEWRLSLNGATNSSLKKIDDFAGEIKNTKYDEVVEDQANGTLTFKANGSDKKTVQTSNPNQITIDAERKKNFDFIRSKVVQDGLVLNEKMATGFLKTFDFTSNVLSVIYNGSLTTLTGGSSYFLQCQVNGTKVVITRLFGNEANRLYVGFIENNLVSKALFYLTDELSHYYSFSFNLTDKSCTVLIDGTPATITTSALPHGTGDLNANNKLQLGRSSLMFSGDGSIFAYNRPLTPSEIQHNFQVLNNSPSISHLQTTDSSGKKSILFGTDSEHVVGRSGKNAEQRYVGLLKNFAKTFDSAKDADEKGEIVINNGIEDSQLLSASIKGRTVKNYLCTIQLTFPYNFINTLTSSFLKQETLIGGRSYYILFDLELEGNGVLETYLAQIPSYPQVPVKNGINKIKITPSKDTSIGYFIIKSATKALLKGDINVVEEGFENFITKPIPLGLSSTEAIIENNGLKYPIYHPTETNPDGSKKVISLPFAEDKVALNDDGSITWVDASNKVVLDGSESTWQAWTDTQNATKNFRVLIQDIKPPTSNSEVLKAICDRFTSISRTSQYTNVTNLSVSCYTTKYLSFIDTSTSTLEEFKAKLKESPVTLQYQIETPIVNTIDKSIAPTISVNKTNILSCDSAVAPSEFKVTVPVDRIAELTTRLEALEAKTNTQPVNTAFIEETYAKSVNKIEKVVKE